VFAAFDSAWLLAVADARKKLQTELPESSERTGREEPLQLPIGATMTSQSEPKSTFTQLVK
jgi:hypothetical protein